MHHAPAGPSLSARLAAAVARARYAVLVLLSAAAPTVRLARRARLLPVLLGGLAITGLALAPPLPAGGEPPASTAALTSPSDDSGRVPATGEGWTQDGLAAAPDSGSATGAAPGSATAEDPPTPDTTASDTTARGTTAPGTTAPAGTPSPSAADAPASPVTVPDAGSTSAEPETAADGPRSAAPRTSESSSSVAATTPSGEPSTKPSRTPSSAAPADDEDGVEDAADDGAAAEVLAAVDSARIDAGCAALAVDAGLTEEALAHSAAMDDRDDLQAPPGPGAVAGERGNPAAVAAAWLADPDLGLTDCSLTAAGIGVVDGWWTLLTD